MKKDTRFKSQKNRPSEHKLKRKPTLYGFHAVREAWLNPERVVEALYLTPQAAGGFEATLAEAREKKLKRPEPETCLLYTSPSPRDRTRYRMPSSA